MQKLKKSASFVAVLVIASSCKRRVQGDPKTDCFCELMTLLLFVIKRLVIHQKFANFVQIKIQNIHMGAQVSNSGMIGVQMAILHLDRIFNHNIKINFYFVTNVLLSIFATE